MEPISTTATATASSMSNYCGKCGVYWSGYAHVCPTTTPLSNVTYWPTSPQVIYMQDPNLVAELKELVDVLKKLAIKLDAIDNND